LPLLWLAYLLDDDWSVLIMGIVMLIRMLTINKGRLFGWTIVLNCPSQLISYMTDLSLLLAYLKMCPYCIILRTIRMSCSLTLKDMGWYLILTSHRNRVIRKMVFICIEKGVGEHDSTRFGFAPLIYRTDMSRPSVLRCYLVVCANTMWYMITWHRQYYN
jgi:hypothetical protein